MDMEQTPLTTASWIFPTITLCMYGFFKDMKPSEPFLTPYLNSSFKNIDDKVISDEIYPVSTYTYLVALFLVFILTDFLRYKPLIILESLAYLATRIILIWGNGVFIMQIMQVTYGIASASEIAYYSYIYTVVDESHYQKVTSYTRAATLVGRGFSDILGQILISEKVTNYLTLNYISFVSVSIAVIITFALPKVQRNIFMIDNYSALESEDSMYECDDIVMENGNCCTQWKLNLKRLIFSFKKSYSNKQLLIWSIWWALAMCGGLQVEDYVMNLWSEIKGANNQSDDYNGAVFACATLLSAFVVFLFSLLKVKWDLIAQTVIGLVAVGQSILLFVMAKTSNIWLAYGCYVIFRTSYAFVLAVASFQIALHVAVHGYALVFGWNTFLALCLQSLLTFIVVDKNGFDLIERDQFIVYGFYFASIAVIFFIRPLYNLVKKCCNVRLFT